MAERTGLAAVLEEAGAGEDVLETPAEQLALLGMELPGGRRSVGRPPGRKNVRSQRVSDFVLATVGDPLIEATRLAMLPVRDLAAAVGISAADALVEKRLLLVAVLPYMHQRQAIAVDVTNRNIVHLNIFGGEAPEAVESGGVTISGGLAEIVEYQGDGDAV